MKIYKTRMFSKSARDMHLQDASLFKAAIEISAGCFEASLGGNIYKKRIALANRGKSSGARTIVAYKVKDMAIFLFGFPKNARNNINNKEELALKYLANYFFNLSDDEINKAIYLGELIEVHNEKGN